MHKRCLTLDHSRKVVEIGWLSKASETVIPELASRSYCRTAGELPAFRVEEDANW